MYPEDAILNPLLKRNPFQQSPFGLNPLADLPFNQPALDLPAQNPLLTATAYESPLPPPPAPPQDFAANIARNEDYQRRVRAYGAGVPMNALDAMKVSGDPQFGERYDYEQSPANPLLASRRTQPAPAAQAPIEPPPNEEYWKQTIPAPAAVQPAQPAPPPQALTNLLPKPPDPVQSPMERIVGAPTQPAMPSMTMEEGFQPNLPPSLPVGPEQFAINQPPLNVSPMEAQNVQGRMIQTPMPAPGTDTTALPQPYLDIPIAEALDPVRLQRFGVGAMGGNDNDILMHELTFGRSMFGAKYDPAQLFPNLSPAELASLTPQQIHEKAISTLNMLPSGEVRLPLDPIDVARNKNFIGQRIQSEIGQSIFPGIAPQEVLEPGVDRPFTDEELPMGFKTMRDVAAGLKRGLIVPQAVESLTESAIEAATGKRPISPTAGADKKSIPYFVAKTLAEAPSYVAANLAAGPVGAGIVGGINSAIDAEGQDAGIKNAAQTLGLGEVGEKVLQRLIPGLEGFAETAATFAAMGPIEKALPFKPSAVKGKIPGVKGRALAAGADVARGAVSMPAAQAVASIPFKAAKSLATGKPMDAPITAEEFAYGAIMGAAMKAIGAGANVAPKMLEAYKESGIGGAVEVIGKVGRPLIVRSESGLVGKIIVEGNEVRFEPLSGKEAAKFEQTPVIRDAKGKVIKSKDGIDLPDMNNEVFRQAFGPNIRSDQAAGWQALIMRRVAGEIIPRGMITDEAIKTFKKSDYFPYEPSVAGANEPIGTQGRPGGPEQAPARQLPPARFELPEKAGPVQFGEKPIEGRPIEGPKPPEVEGPKPELIKPEGYTAKAKIPEKPTIEIEGVPKMPSGVPKYVPPTEPPPTPKPMTVEEFKGGKSIEIPPRQLPTEQAAEGTQPLPVPDVAGKPAVGAEPRPSEGIVPQIERAGETPAKQTVEAPVREGQVGTEARAGESMGLPAADAQALERPVSEKSAVPDQARINLAKNVLSNLDRRLKAGAITQEQYDALKAKYTPIAAGLPSEEKKEEEKAAAPKKPPKIDFPSEEALLKGKIDETRKLLGDDHPAVKHLEDLSKSLEQYTRHPVTGMEAGATLDNTIKRAMQVVKDPQSNIEGHYIFADIKNLGGLNEAFAQEGANKHFKAITDIFNEELNKIEGGAAVGIHVGGDEIGSVVMNASQSEIDSAFDKIKQRVADYVNNTKDVDLNGKEVGLSEIIHPKDLHKPEAERRIGTGLTAASIQIEPDDTLEEIKNDAAMALQRKKYALGYTRRKEDIDEGRKVREEAEGVGPQPPSGQAGGTGQGTGAGAIEANREGEKTPGEPSKPAGEIEPTKSLLGEPELNAFFEQGDEGAYLFDSLESAVRASYDPQDLFFPNLPENIQKSVEKIAAERYKVEKAREDKVFPSVLKEIADEFNAYGVGDQMHWKTDDQKQALGFYDQVKTRWRYNGYDLSAAIESVYEQFKPSKDAPDEDLLDLLDRFKGAADYAAEKLAMAEPEEEAEVEEPPPTAKAPAAEPTKLTKPAVEEKKSVELGEETVPGTRDFIAAIKERIASNKPIKTPTELFELGKEFLKGNVGADYGPQDAYNALEAAANSYLLDILPKVLQMEPKEALEGLNNVMARLPYQRARDAAKVEKQQFSTPPTLAYAAAYALNPQAGERVAEPSAGTGGLAVFAKAAGAEVDVNEIDPKRASLMTDLGFPNVTSVNAGQYNSRIGKALTDAGAKDVRPTAILMNPPFSRDVNMPGKKTRGVDEDHIDSALLRLADGGRLVAIVGRGFTIPPAWFNKYNIRANIGLSGKEYERYGTGFDNRLLVIDKTGTTREKGNIAKGEDLSYAQALDLLKGVRDDRTKAIRPDKPGSSVGGDTGHIRGSSGKTGGSVGGGTGGVQPSGRDVGPEVVSKEGGGVGGEGSVGTVPKEEPKPKPARTAERKADEDSKGTDSDVDADDGGIARNRAYSGVSTRNVIKEAKESGVWPKKSKYHVLDGFVHVFQNPDDMPDVISEFDPAEKKQDKYGKTTGMTLMRGFISPKARADYDEQRGVKEPTQKMEERGEPVKTEVVEGTPFVRYQPSFEPVSPHKGNIVETASMAGMAAPKIDPAKAEIPKPLILAWQQGKLSDLQIEFVARAHIRHVTVLPDGTIGGILNGDGTGVGKGRQMAAVIYDNWLQGRKKALWISVNSNLLPQAKGDMADIGAESIPLRFLGDFKAKDRIADSFGDGVLFMSYMGLASEGEQADEGQTRIKQIMDWMGDEPTIILDEVHKAKNYFFPDDPQAKPTNTALAVNALHEKFPKARFVYASATSATEPRHMAVMSRLGLWGTGTAFPTGFPAFEALIKRGGLGAMEMVAREMKGMGVYVSRNLSYEGAEHTATVHQVTPAQEKMYEVAANAWDFILNNIGLAIDQTGGGGRQRARAMMAFGGANQRFFETLITAIKVPTLIKDIQQALDSDHSVVVSLVKTGDAQAGREEKRIKQEGGSLDEMDFTPRDIILHYLRKAFPVQEYEQVTDDKGNVKTVKATHADGSAVKNPEAERLRDEAIAHVERLTSGDFALPDNPLDQILRADFTLKEKDKNGKEVVRKVRGKDIVAEVTGRSGQYLPDPETGQIKKFPRPNVKSEISAFNSGKKRVLILSGAGSTGLNAHAWRRNPPEGQKRRWHIKFQLNWSAEVNAQSDGRTLRTDQVSAPVYDLLYSNIGGEARFAASAAKRMADMGAITRGSREATGGGELSKFNYNTTEGRSALASTYLLLADPRRYRADQLPPGFWQEFGGIEQGKYWGAEALQRMRIMRENGDLDDGSMEDINRFFNRLLALPIKYQNPIFKLFDYIFGVSVEKARREGTLDTGVKMFKAHSVKINPPSTIYKDPTTGGETHHYSIDVGERTNPYTWDSLQRHNKDRREAPNFINRQQGYYTYSSKIHPIVYAAYLNTRTAQDGTTEHVYFLNSPEEYWFTNVTEAQLAKYKKVEDESEAKRIWDEGYRNVPEIRYSKRHLIADLILNLWDRISEAAKLADAGTISVESIQDTETGQAIVGAHIPYRAIMPVLKELGFGEGAEVDEMDPSELYDLIMDLGETVPLLHGIELKQSSVYFGKTIEVKGEGNKPLSSDLGRTIRGYGIEPYYGSGSIARYLLPTNGGAGIDMLKKILKDFPVKPSAKPKKEKAKEEKKEEKPKEEKKPAKPLSYEEIMEAEYRAGGVPEPKEAPSRTSVPGPYSRIARHRKYGIELPEITGAADAVSAKPGAGPQTIRERMRSNLPPLETKAESGFIAVGGATTVKPGAQGFSSSPGPQLNPKLLNVAPQAIAFSQDMVRPWSGSVRTNLQYDLKRLGYPDDIADKVADRMIRFKSDLPAALADADKKVNDVKKSLPRRIAIEEPAAGLRTAPTKVVGYVGRKRMNELLWAGAHAVEDFHSNGKPKFNRWGIVFDVIDWPAMSSLRQAVQSYMTANGLGSTPLSIQVLDDGRIRIFKKFLQDEAEDLYAEAITGIPDAKYSDYQSGKIKARPELLDALKEFNKSRHEAAAEYGIDPLPGHIHHIPEKPFMAGFKKMFAKKTASPRRMSTGKLFRTDAVKKDFFESWRQELHELEKERIRNAYVADQISLMGRRSVEDEKQYDLIKGEGKELGRGLLKLIRRRDPVLDEFPDIPLDDLKQAGYMLQARGIWMPHSAVLMLQEDLGLNNSWLEKQLDAREAEAETKGQSEKAMAIRGIRWMYLAAQDVFDIFAISRLGAPVSAIRDFTTTGLMMHPIKIVEDFFQDVMDAMHGDDRLFTRTRHDLLAYPRMGARALKMLAGKKAPKHLRKEYLPDSLYMDPNTVQGRTVVGRTMLPVAQMAAALKTWFDAVGKRLILESSLMEQAEKRLRAKGLKPFTKDYNEAHAKLLADLPPDMLVEARRASNEYAFGGDGLNPMMQRAGRALSAKAFLPTYFKFFAKLLTTLQQRTPVISSIGSRNRRAMGLETNPAKIEITALEKMKIWRQVVRPKLLAAGGQPPIEPPQGPRSKSWKEFDDEVNRRRFERAAKNRKERNAAIARILSGWLFGGVVAVGAYAGLQKYWPTAAREKNKKGEFVSGQYDPSYQVFYGEDEAGYQYGIDVRGLSPAPEIVAVGDVVSGKISIAEYLSQQQPPGPLFKPAAKYLFGISAPEDEKKTTGALLAENIAGGLPGAPYVSVAKRLLDPSMKQQFDYGANTPEQEHKRTSGEKIVQGGKNVASALFGMGKQKYNPQTGEKRVYGDARALGPVGKVFSPFVGEQRAKILEQFISPLVIKKIDTVAKELSERPGAAPSTFGIDEAKALNQRALLGLDADQERGLRNAIAEALIKELQPLASRYAQFVAAPDKRPYPDAPEEIKMLSKDYAAAASDEARNQILKRTAQIAREQRRPGVIKDAAAEYLKSIGKGDTAESAKEAVKSQNKLVPADVAAYNYRVSVEADRAVSALKSDTHFLKLKPTVQEDVVRDVRGLYGTYKVKAYASIPEKNRADVLKNSKQAFGRFMAAPDMRNKPIKQILEDAARGQY